MDDPDEALKPPSTPLAERIQAFIEVVLLSGLLSTYFAGLIFSAFHGGSVDLAAMGATNVSAFILLEAAFALLLLAVILTGKPSAASD